jgi:hypothetical protein
LEGKLKEFFALNSDGHAEMIAAMRRNLEAGDLRFVVVMDEMDDGLKNLITYVNDKSRFAIYGVELEYCKYEDYEILIPKLYGSESKKDQAA